MKYKVVSLFAGIGGIDLGFKLAGIETIWANEIDDLSAKTYKVNNPKVKLDVNDIKNINGREIPQADILTAGFPCQAFSIAGSRMGFKDDRGNLFFEIIRLIEEMAENHNKPKVIFLENVKNLYTHDNGNTYKVIKKSLEKQGYTVYSKILNSSEYGNVPQNRERLYIVAFLSKDIEYTWPSKIPLTNKITKVINWNDKVAEKYYYKDNLKCYKVVKEGVKKIHTIYQLRRVYIRENKSNLCPTLTANMGTGGHNVPLILDNNKSIRKLTPRECLRLQGFPDNFIIPKSLSNSSIYKQAGNSVTVAVIIRIAEKIKESLDNEEIDQKIKQISGSMAQEGMPLTKEVKENIRKCLIGESTTEIECQKVIEKYKIIYEKNN